MKVCIHRGSKEIGGTCIEIEAQGQRMVLDVGLPLDAMDPLHFPLPLVKGFDKPDPSLLAVVISHPHQDHYGLAHRLPKATKFLIGKAADRILTAAEVFSPAGIELQNVRYLADRKPMQIGPFTITPYLVDHSAFDAYAVLVEADGKTLFYTGDLRAHGRKAALFHKLLRLPPRHVDVLLMEGTTLGREDGGKGFATETDLEGQFVTLFKETDGMPLVWCSGQNIDRMVTILRACIRAERTPILDMYTAHVLQATGNKSIVGACNEHMRVFLPEFQKRRVKRRGDFNVSKRYSKWRIYDPELRAKAPYSVMVFRPSMMQDVEKAGCLNGARLIYSMWRGYLDDRKQKPFLDWLKQREIPLVHCHTSGHASVGDLMKLRKRFSAAPVVPIHTEQPGRYEEVFGNVQRHKDGEWWEVDHV
ncbi:MAG: MBL fold metallo-hydrolase [Phycisphaerae bacterium]